MISIKQFNEIELKVGEIIKASHMENADNLLKLLVDIKEGSEILAMGPEGVCKPIRLGSRVILSGIAEHYKPEELIGKRCIVVSNLEPKEMRGVKSEGMILCASFEDKVKIIEPDKNIPIGSIIK